MSEGKTQSYYKPDSAKERYIRVTTFFKALASFVLASIVIVSMAAFFTFIFYGGFVHPFFDYGPELIVGYAPWMLLTATIGAAVFAIVRAKTINEQNQLFIDKNSLDITRGLYFKSKLSLPFSAIFNIRAYQSAYGRRVGLVKAEMVLVNGKSVFLGVFDEDSYRKFEDKLMRNMGKLTHHDHKKEEDRVNSEGLPVIA